MNIAFFMQYWYGIVFLNCNMHSSGAVKSHENTDWIMKIYESIRNFKFETDDGAQDYCS